MESVWHSFIATYNEPPNAFQLVNYSRDNSSLPTLTYKQAKQLTRDNKDAYEEHMKRHKSTYTKLNKNNHNHKRHKRGKSNKFKNNKPIKGRTNSDATMRSKLFIQHKNKTKNNSVNKKRKSEYKAQKSRTPKHGSTNRRTDYFNNTEMSELMSLKPIKTSVIRSKSQHRTNKHSRNRSQTVRSPNNNNNNGPPGPQGPQLTIDFDMNKQQRSSRKRKSKKYRKPKPVNIKHNHNHKYKNDNYNYNKFDNKYNLSIGDYVLLTQNRKGIVLYIGQVHFAKGIWFGLELINSSSGSHDGIIGQKRYFQTPPNRGIFVQASRICGKLSLTKQASSPLINNSNSTLVSSPKIAESSDYSDNDNDIVIIRPHSAGHKYKYHGYANRNGNEMEKQKRRRSKSGKGKNNNNNNLSPMIEPARPLYMVEHENVNGNGHNIVLPENKIVLSEMDMIQFKSLLRAEIETEFESKFNELKQMLIEKRDTESENNNIQSGKRKRKYKKRDKKTKKSKTKRHRHHKKIKKKEKKTLDKLKKMEKRRRAKLKKKQLKQSETDLNNQLNIETNNDEIDNGEHTLSDDYQKNSDLYVTESVSDNDKTNEEEEEEEDDEQEELELTIITDVGKNHGRNISLVSNSNKSPNNNTPTTNISDFDDNDIRYNVVQQLPKRKHFWNTIK